MIEYVKGNLLQADTEALVNTVNTVGVMGKGIALQFRQAFPFNYQVYRKACEKNELHPGQVLVVPTGMMSNPKFIINVPTKRHWKGKARIEDIESGLEALVIAIKDHNISSIAVPPLGCGNGGLDWSNVRPRIELAFAALPDVRALVYAPEGAPNVETMPVATKRPNMTRGRAALIGLLRKYIAPGYRLSLLEVQKLAYFLDTAGESLRLNFKRGRYGPYSETLHHVLQDMEGHYIRGYGDRSRDASIRLLPRAAEDANRFLEIYPDTQARLERVAELIDGFETPYGLELLATVHWLTRDDPRVCYDSRLAVQGVQAWNERKRRTFQPGHVFIAWSQLKDQGWLTESAPTN